jgi:hypothetical protein
MGRDGIVSVLCVWSLMGSCGNEVVGMQPVLLGQLRL